jgi:hypothetical protein
MSTQVQFRRGTTTQNNAFTGAQGELSVDTDLKTIRLHDGTTAGGGSTMLNNVSAQTALNKTFSTGSAWQGNAVALAYGGTGSALTAAAGAVSYSTSSGLALNSPGTSGQILVSGGTGAPTWVAGSSLSVGTATLATTATNIAGGSAGQLIIQSDTNLSTFITAGASGTFLRSEGAGYAPSWATADVTIGSTVIALGSSSTSLAGLNVLTATGTSNWKIPVGTTGQRPGTPATGMIRYNSTISSFEGYAASAWASLGGVKSVDGFTFIQAETSAGASNGDIDFYAEDSAGTAATQVGQWNRTNLKDYTGTLVGTQTTQNVFNATATTVNAFGAATTLNLGAANGTTTVANRLKLSRANSTADGTGQILLDGANGNRIDWGTAGTAAPSFTTRSVGTKLTLYPALGASAVDYAIGVNSATLWNSIPGNDAAQFFKWYGGETEVASLSGTGNLILVGDLQVKGGDITTDQTTFNLLNATATTLNIGGAATTLSIGAATGTLTINNANTVITGNLTVNGTTTTVNSTTVDIQNAFVFEGATADGFETTLSTVDPTADRTILLPDASDTLVGKATTDTLTNKTLTGPTLTLPIVNNTKQGYSTTATASGTTTLTVNSNYAQFFTGTAAQTLVLPAPETMTLGMQYLIVNNSTGTLQVNAANTAVTATVIGGIAVLITCVDTTAGGGATSWSVETVGFSGVTGTGSVVLATSPSLTTPTIGSAGANFSGSTSGTTALVASATASGTLTLPTTTDTLVGRNTTDTLTNKTLTSPTLTTPTLGVATATSINKVAITAPATGSTLTIANDKTFTVNNSITLAGTDSTTITLPSTTGTLPLNNQSFYIGTTSVAINRESASLALTGISSITLPGSTSGTAQIISSAVAGTSTVLTLPATSGIVALAGYPTSTTSLPTGDLMTGEVYAGETVPVDAFGIAIIPIYTLMEPVGSIVTVDLNT